jgi:hypothetical protein
MNYIKPHQQRIINALYKNIEQRALVRGIYYDALSRSTVNVHMYNSQYTMQQLHEWHKMYSKSDSLLSADIIDHYKTAVASIIKLMNTL